MIKLQVIGHLGKDCTTNQVNGKNVINFSVAHSEKFTDSTGNVKEKTTWVECAYWTDKTAVANYLKKGKEVYVEGIPEVRQFTRNDGTAGSSLSMRVNSVQLLGGSGPQSQNDNSNSGSNSNIGNTSNNQQSNNMPANQNYTSQPVKNNDPVLDDLPF